MSTLPSRKFKVIQQPIPFYSRNNNLKISDIDKSIVHRESSRYGPRYDAAFQMKNGKVKSFAVGSSREEAHFIVEQLNAVLHEVRQPEKSAEPFSLEFSDEEIRLFGHLINSPDSDWVLLKPQEQINELDYLISNHKTNESLVVDD